MGRVRARMTRNRWLVVGGALVVAVVLFAAMAGRLRQADGADASVTGASPGAGSMPTDPPTAEPTATPEPTPTPEVSATPEPTPELTPEPTPEPTPTDPPTARGDPRLLYAEFLLRVNDDRATVDRLNAALGTAAQAQDTKGVHDASVDILDFADAERDWLRDHPPAKCYATAHKAARSMIAAYGTAAERFLDWSATGGGLKGLDALGKAVDAANVAADRLTAFGKALEGTTCPG